jgi:NADH:ubiquinone oxidoreductase subunit 4 (subunit M)
MLLSLLILIPLFGTLIIFIFYTNKNNEVNEKAMKITALSITIVDLFLSFII